MGTWDADKLGGNDEVTVAFTDGSRYEGYFKDWCYSGRGRLVYLLLMLLTYLGLGF